MTRISGPTPPVGQPMLMAPPRLTFWQRLRARAAARRGLGEVRGCDLSAKSICDLPYDSACHRAWVLAQGMNPGVCYTFQCSTGGIHVCIPNPPPPRPRGTLVSRLLRPIKTGFRR